MKLLILLDANNLCFVFYSLEIEVEVQKKGKQEERSRKKERRGRYYSGGVKPHSPTLLQGAKINDLLAPPPGLWPLGYAPAHPPFPHGEIVLHLRHQCHHPCGQDRVNIGVYYYYKCTHRPQKSKMFAHVSCGISKRKKEKKSLNYEKKNSDKQQHLLLILKQVFEKLRKGIRILVGPKNAVLWRNFELLKF